MIGDERGVDLSGTPERRRLILASLRYQSLLARNSITVTVLIRHMNEWMGGGQEMGVGSPVNGDAGAFTSDVSVVMRGCTTWSGHKLTGGLRFRYVCELGSSYTLPFG